MATVAVGDLHGNLSALEDLLDKVLSELNPADELVFLGDYIDRGPDSRGCIDRILALRNEAAFAVVTLLGNHEDWMLKSRENPARHSWILAMQGFSTIRSYSIDAAARIGSEIETAGPRLITEEIPLPYHLFFDSLPPAHLAFFEGLKPFHRTPDAVCVHGGLDPHAGRVERQDVECLIWGTDDFVEKYRGEDAIIYGHWNNAVLDWKRWPRPCITENRTFGIDTISHGVLTAIRLPDGKVFQSRRFKTR
ncbi:MAG: serine/threonine protein phosphatase [Acidobacteria bacterium]|nr:serine/threonine protein phosphatase [Acidobacteriota bacterium]